MSNPERHIGAERGENPGEQGPCSSEVEDSGHHGAPVIVVYETFTGATHVLERCGSHGEVGTEAGAHVETERMKGMLKLVTGIQEEDQILHKVVPVPEEYGHQEAYYVYDKSVLKHGQVNELFERLSESQKQEEELYRKQCDEWIEEYTTNTRDTGGDVEEKMVEVAKGMYDACENAYGNTRVMSMAVEYSITRVEPHYVYISNILDDFQKNFEKQKQQFDDIMSTWEADVDTLKSIEILSKDAESKTHHLSDLVDIDSLRDIAKECQRAESVFCGQVQEVEEEFARLKDDVENLYLRAPPVDMDQLLSHMEDSRQELMRHDRVDVEQLIRNASDFAINFSRAKFALLSDVILIMRSVSSQQSRIRSMRDAMEPFITALGRQNAKLKQLEIVRQLPIAYKQCLAECIRRNKFSDKYATFASELAERMGKFRDKEISVRDQFLQKITSVMPRSVITSLGLESPAPFCEVSILEEEKPLFVSMEQLKKIPSLPSPVIAKQHSITRSHSSPRRDIIRSTESPSQSTRTSSTPRTDDGTKNDDTIMQTSKSSIVSKSAYDAEMAAKDDLIKRLQMENDLLRQYIQ